MSFSMSAPQLRGDFRLVKKTTGANKNVQMPYPEQNIEEQVRYNGSYALTCTHEGDRNHSCYLTQH